jgi:hypothetical protein
MPKAAAVSEKFHFLELPTRGVAVASTIVDN